MGMTIETRQYIELTDILAMVVVCEGCSASLSLPINSDVLRLPLNCPNCGAEWSQPPAPTTKPLSKAERLRVFYEAFHKLRQSLASKSVTSQFRFTLEIAAPRKEGQQ